MGYNLKRKKSNEQKRWENRKLKMAGLTIEEVPIEDDNIIDIQFKDIYIFNKISHENLFDFSNKLYLIGNRKSLFYEKHKLLYDNIVNEKSSVLPFLSNSIDYKNLPVYKKKDEFLDFFENNNILVVTGETGCGKSTLIPKFIYDKYKYRICITQPRKIAVLSLFKKLNSSYGNEVGYAIRFNNKISPQNKINIMTEGILIKEFSSDALLTRYNLIICDEIHERSINIDIILGFIKLLINHRSDIKIILMSATININKYCNFLNAVHFNFDGNRFPVQIKYLKINVDDYIEWTVKKIINIYLKEQNGDILVFLSGKEDINQIYKLLHIYLIKEKPFNIITLYSEILEEVYDKIFSYDIKIRKCILSTNVAEASITIPNIKYVIDTGFHKLNYYDYKRGDRLIKYPISKENAIQRAGRAGRLEPGVCYRMYTETSYLYDLPDSNIPDILRCNISSVLLILFNSGIKQLETFPLLSKPSKLSIELGIKTLIILEAIDFKFCLTKLGIFIINLGIDPVLGKLIMEGINYSCSYEASLLASILSIDNFLIFDYLKNVDTDNEFLSLLDIVKINDNKFLNLIKKIKYLHKNIIYKIEQLGYKIKSSRNINIAILRTFYFNLTSKENKFYIHLANKEKFCLTNSFIESQYVLFYKIFTNKFNESFMQICCSVDQHDILKYCSKYFKTYENDKKKFDINIFENLYDRFILDEN